MTPEPQLPPRLGRLQKILDALFYPPTDRFSTLFGSAWLAGLVIAGIWLWGVFFSWGNISFDFHDWAEVTGPRYAMLSDAAQKGVFPLHAGNTTTLRGVTDRYLAIPDTPISPQFLLLRFLDAGRYIFLDTLFFYLLGSLGLVLFYRRYRLSPFVFTILFLLFHFNGYIVNHLAVGHSIWVGYFLLPFFVLLVFSLIEQQRGGWAWLLAVSGLFVVMLAQGFFHLYVWCLMFLALLAAFNWRLARPILLAGVFSVLVALPRLLPPALILEGITHEHLGGFGSAADILSSLVVLRDPDRAFMVIPTQTYPLGWWELNYYIGLLGFIFIAACGVFLPLWRTRFSGSSLALVLAPSLALTILSLGRVYWYLIKLAPVPPFTGERVTARFFILPLVFLLFLGAVYLQRALQARRLTPGWQALGLALAGVLLHDLYNHMGAWRIRYIDGLTYLFPKVPFDRSVYSTANHTDPVYTAILAGGAAVSAAVLAFLAWKAVRERKSAAGTRL